MTGSSPKRIEPVFHKPAFYRIHAQGILDESWSARLGGMAIAVKQDPDSAPVTTLYGHVPDQAALSGILNALCDLGLSLLSVECLADT